MLLIQQRNQDGVDAYRFPLACRPRHQEMGHGCEIHDEILIVDLFADRDRQAEITMLELIRGQQGPHTDHRLLYIGHFDTDRAFPRYGRNDPDTEGREAQGNIIFEVLDAGDAYARGRNDLVQRVTVGPTVALDLLRMAIS